MKILIITQKLDIDDDILGFFHKWVEVLARQFEHIAVICLEQGNCELPNNVSVFSLGKEKGVPRLKRYLLFYKFLLSNIRKTDGIFFHMCPEYVLAESLIAKFYKKKTLLWYTHKTINWKLRLAEKLVDKIFTASKESFRLESKKVEVTGHGIDIQKFIPPEAGQNAKGKSDGKFRIITVGRITPVKNLHLLIEVAEILKNKNFDFKIEIAGTPILEKDREYLEKLKRNISDKKLDDYVDFIGKIPYKEIEKFYQSADIFVNFSDTGSIDKAVLEAMASGLAVLTSNEAFRNIIPQQYITSKNPQEIEDKIVMLSAGKIDSSLTNYVVNNHSLEALINKIIGFYGYTNNS